MKKLLFTTICFIIAGCISAPQAATKVKQYPVTFDSTITATEPGSWAPVDTQTVFIEMPVGAVIVSADQSAKNKIKVWAVVDTAAEDETVRIFFVANNTAFSGGAHILSFQFGPARKSCWLHVFKQDM